MHNSSAIHCESCSVLLRASAAVTAPSTDHAIALGEPKCVSSADQTIVKQADVHDGLCAYLQKRMATLLAGFLASATSGNVCVRNSLRMVSELSPQFPCTPDSDRIIRGQISESVKLEEAKPDAERQGDIIQLLHAARRALDSSRFKPRDAAPPAAAASEDGRAEEGELVAEMEGGGQGGVPAPRGRGANMGDPNVGHKRGREHSGNIEAGRRPAQPGRSTLGGHRSGRT